MLAFLWLRINFNVVAHYVRRMRLLAEDFRENKVNFASHGMQQRPQMCDTVRRLRKSVLCNRQPRCMLVDHDGKKVAATDSQTHVATPWKFDNAAAEINFRKGGR